MLTYKECVELREKFLNGEILLESTEETLSSSALFKTGVGLSIELCDFFSNYKVLIVYI